MIAASAAEASSDSKTISAPLLSVIVPALDVDLELRRCIDSLRLALSGADRCELVLVLPGRYVADARRVFPNALVVAESRAGVYAAMNDGVSASTGRYLYFLGKDDILLPTMADVVGVLATESPSIVFADVYWGAEGVRSTRSSRWAILFRNVCHQGIVYSREALVRHGPFVRRFRVRADQLLNIRVLWDESLRNRARYLQVPVVWYAAEGLSFTTPDRVFYRVQPAIIRRYVGPVVAWAWCAYKRLRPEKGMR